MSEVWIGAEEAARGTTPSLCAKTGERCITRHRLPDVELSPLVRWGSWANLWPRRRRTEERAVVLSLLPGVARLHRGLGLARDVTAAAILLGFVVLAAWPELLAGPARIVVLAALAVKALVALIGVRWAIDVRADVTGEWLRLSGVHEDFVAALEPLRVPPASTPVLQSPVPEAGPQRAADGSGVARPAASDGT